MTRRSALPLALLAALAPACAPAPAPPPARSLSPGQGKIAVEGGEVWYEIVGSGSATPVLTLHPPGGRVARYDEASPETVAWYQSLIPGSRLEIFEEASHMTMLEQPDEYLRVLRGFLADVEKGGGTAQ